MKQSEACPKCACRMIYVLQEDLKIAEEPSIGVQFAARRVGHLEAYICAACGFCERYVKGLEQLRGLSQISNSGVRMLDGSAKAPYR